MIGTIYYLCSSKIRARTHARSPEIGKAHRRAGAVCGGGNLIADLLDAFLYMEWLRVADEDDRVTVDRQPRDCSLTSAGAVMLGMPHV